MDFSRSETQLQIRDLAAQIFADYTTQEKLRTLDETGYYDPALWAQLAEAGLLGLAIGEACGGMAMEFDTLCVLLEEAGRHVAPVPLLPVLVTAALPLQALAGDERVAAVLSDLASGSSLVTAALFETPCVSPLFSTSTATNDSGAWHISGQKQQVPAASLAGHCWTAALAEDEPVILLFALDAPGVTQTSQLTTNGELESQLELQRVPAHLLVRGSEAERFLQQALDVSLAGSNALALGLCEEMIRLAADYTSERQQFGRPIATFQAVAHRLADCHIDTQCLRAAQDQAVCRLAEAQVDEKDTRQAILSARFLATEALHRVSHGTQQVHGGTGVDRDYPLFRYCLWARQVELGFGGAGATLQQLGRMLCNEKPE